MKKKLTIIAIVAICLAIISGGTLAYYTHTDTARNVITSGGIKVQIVEQQLVNGALQEYPAEDEAIQIMPGTSVSKIVSVKSLQQSAWIRMSYTLSVLDPEGKPMDVSAEELARIITIDTDSTSWTEKDGWYYYNAPLSSADEGSKPLFTSVSFSGPNMGNEYQSCTLHIDVKAQAVQQANNGSTVTEAIWPDA